MGILTTFQFYWGIKIEDIPLHNKYMSSSCLF